MLRPDRDWALPVTLGLGLAALAVFWLPRQRRQLPLGLIAVAVMAVLAVVLGAASYVPCRGGLSMTGAAFWVLHLFVGQPAPVYPGGESALVRRRRDCRPRSSSGLPRR